MCGDFLNFFSLFSNFRALCAAFSLKENEQWNFHIFSFEKDLGHEWICTATTTRFIIIQRWFTYSFFSLFLFSFLHLLKGIYEFLTWRNQEEKTNYSFGRKTSCAKKSGVKDKSHRRLYIPSFVIVNFKKLLQNRSFIIEYKQ